MIKKLWHMLALSSASIQLLAPEQNPVAYSQKLSNRPAE